MWSRVTYMHTLLCLFHSIFFHSIESAVLLAGVCVCWSRCSRVIWGPWWRRSSGSVQWDPNPAEESEHMTESQLTPWVLRISSPLWKKRQAKTTRGVTWRSYSMRPVLFHLCLFTSLTHQEPLKRQTSMLVTCTRLVLFYDRCVFLCADGRILWRLCRMANVPQLHTAALQACQRLDVGL